MLKQFDSFGRGISSGGKLSSVATLLADINRIWDASLKSKDLVVLETSSTYIQENGMNFLVRLLKSDGLKKKGSNIKSPQAAITDPFDYETLNRNLLVHTFENHVLLLNKFPVMKNHCVLVTKSFKSQCSPLTQDDFEAVSSILSQIPSLVFYNCGVDSGASQSHKHIQLIPYNSFENGQTPFDEYMEGKGITSNSMCQCPLYPFDHVLYPVSSYTDPHALYQHYSEMIEHLIKKRQSEGKKLESYNFLLFKKWLMIVPRTRETWNSINVNSLGFTGSFLVKREETLEVLKKTGLLYVLSHVVD